jgi:hypothetical protein
MVGAMAKVVEQIEDEDLVLNSVGSTSCITSKSSDSVFTGSLTKK